MSRYKCIKNYTCDYYDEDGLCTEKKMTIQKDRIFEETDESLIGAEVNLIDYESGDWLGMPKETLEEYFEKLED